METPSSMQAPRHSRSHACRAVHREPHGHAEHSPVPAVWSSLVHRLWFGRRGSGRNTGDPLPGSVSRRDGRRPVDRPRCRDAFRRLIALNAISPTVLDRGPHYFLSDHENRNVYSCLASARICAAYWPRAVLCRNLSGDGSAWSIRPVPISIYSTRRRSKTRASRSIIRGRAPSAPASRRCRDYLDSYDMSPDGRVWP